MFGESLDWTLILVAAIFAVVVFATSTLSLQGCIAMFGKEIPAYRETARLKLKIFGWIGLVTFLGYGFLGSFFILVAPIGFLIAVAMISKSANCDRFMGVLITMCHTGMSGLGILLCAFVFSVVLPFIGLGRINENVAGMMSSSRGDAIDQPSQELTPVGHRPVRSSGPHDNPFVAPADDA